jgi:glycopeptide antibiotics resistance protein
LKDQTVKRLTKAGWLLFYLYMILLLYFLFFSEHYGRDINKEYRYNLELFKEIKRFIQYREQLGLESFVVNVLGNILAFAPFGFMLPVLSKSYRHFFYTTFLSLFFSLCVEMAQMLMKVGIFDVDDIFLNTIGGISGYLFYLVFSKIISVLFPKKKKSRGKHK